MEILRFSSGVLSPVEGVAEDDWEEFGPAMERLGYGLTDHVLGLYMGDPILELWERQGDGAKLPDRYVAVVELPERDAFLVALADTAALLTFEAWVAPVVVASMRTQERQQGLPGTLPLG
jgi:hypothetical protein